MIKTLANILFPKKCIFCGSVLPVGAPICICEECAPHIPYYAGDYLFNSAGHSDNYLSSSASHSGNYLSSSANRSGDYRSNSAGHSGGKVCDRILCALKYDGAVRKTLSRYKFYGRGEYGLTLAALLCERVVGTEAERVDEYDLVTCVPLTHKRMRERGYNQAAILAYYTAQSLSLAFAGDLLSRDEGALRQSTLQRSERYKNAQTTFHINEQTAHALASTNAPLHTAPLSGMHILLVDDIATSMSTLNACAAVLKAAGAHEVIGAVLASA